MYINSKVVSFFSFITLLAKLNVQVTGLIQCSKPEKKHYKIIYEAKIQFSIFY